MPRILSFDPRNEEKCRKIQERLDSEELRIRSEEERLLTIRDTYRTLLLDIAEPRSTEFELHKLLEKKDMARLLCAIDKYGIYGKESARYFLSKLGRMLGTSDVSRSLARKSMYAVLPLCAIVRADINRVVRYVEDWNDQLCTELLYELLKIKPYDQFVENKNYNVYGSTLPRLTFSFDAMEYCVREMFEAWESEVLFNRNDSCAKRVLSMSGELKHGLPSEFYKDPSLFIESLPIVKQNRDNIGSYLLTDQVSGVPHFPYDVTKVREFDGWIVKRVDLQKVRYALEEVTIAEQARSIFAKHSFTDFAVQEFHGIVCDRGNMYLFSKYIPGLHADSDYPDQREALKKMKCLLKDVHPDVESRNVIVSPDGEKFTLIDFETKPVLTPSEELAEQEEAKEA